MRRFSISRLMLIVAVLAGNFALIRFLGRFNARNSPITTPQLFTGMMPLLDGVLFASWMVLRRNRIRCRLRPLRDPGRFVLWFALLGGVMLIVAFVVDVLDEDAWTNYLQYTSTPVKRLLRWRELMQYDGLIHGVVSPIFLVAVMSGPPIVLAVVLGYLASRLRIEVTPRVTGDEVGPS